MAKKTTITTPLQNACEQYVVEELKQAKQELAELKVGYEIIKEKYVNLWEKLVLIMIGEETKLEESKCSSDITSVYLLGGYVGCYSKYSLEHYPDASDIKMKTLADLIEMVKSTPTREQ